MIHQPLGGMGGQASEIMIAGEHIRQTKQTLNEILTVNHGRNLADVRKDTDRDYWMKASEVLEYGIVDWSVPLKKSNERILNVAKLDIDFFVVKIYYNI